jgi:hypothetical protein
MVIHAHVEKLLLVVFATRARSCEIVQAILVSTASRSDMFVDFSDPKSHRHTLAQRDGRQPRAQDQSSHPDGRRRWAAPSPYAR